MVQYKGLCNRAYYARNQGIPGTMNDTFREMSRTNIGMKLAKAVFPALLLLCLCITIPAMKVDAAGYARFGSVSYNPAQGTNFNIGVYVGNNEDNGLLVGTYSVTLTYDANAITYVGGASSGGNGSVVVSGTSANGGESMHMLTFHANTAANTTLSVSSVAVNDINGNPMASAPLVSAPITIQGGVTIPPEYILINGKQIPGFANGRTEYTFSIPYSDEAVIEAPEGYKITSNIDELNVGRNEVEVSVSNNDGEPIVYKLHINMEKNRNEDEKTSEKTSEDADKDGKDSKTDKTEKTSEKTEKSSEKVSEKVSEYVAPPMPEEKSKKEDGLSGEKKSLFILCGFGALIIVIVGLKFIIDGVAAQTGHHSDVKNLRTKDKLARQEKIDEKAAPFEYASFEEGKEQAPVQGHVDLRLKTVDRDEAKTASSENAPQVGSNGKEIPKLDFSKRKSASRMAREEMAAEEAAQEAENIDGMSQEDVENYMEALDASSASVEDDFLDLDDVADRVTKK